MTFPIKPISYETIQFVLLKGTVNNSTLPQGRKDSSGRALPLHEWLMLDKQEIKSYYLYISI